MERIEGVVLAAGEGRRMRSRRPKVLHEILGLPMGAYVLRAMREAVDRVWVVTGYRCEEVEEGLRQWCSSFVRQGAPKGTGDALRTVVSSLTAPLILVAPGDVPLIRGSTLRGLVEHHLREGMDVTVLTAFVKDPEGYGRVVRDGGAVVAIVEDREASLAEKALQEVNTGVYLFSLSLLVKALPLLSPHPPKGEYYLPDVVSWAVKGGYKVGAVQVKDPLEGMGVNTRRELAKAWGVLRDRKNEALMEGGVTIVDPCSTYVDVEVEVGQDTVIAPWVQIQGKSRLEEDCLICSHVRIRDSHLGKGARVLEASYMEGVTLGEGVRVGPMAHLRPGTVLGAEVKVGNFVEVKGSQLGAGTKASHLAYIGDATIGRGVNVGAGTITCNYDGFRKHPTIIGDGVFIGSDTQLVAPVRVGDHALIGAGSTITKDVPENALALSRTPQKIFAGKGMLYLRKRRGR